MGKPRPKEAMSSSRSCLKRLLGRFGPSKNDQSGREQSQEAEQVFRSVEEETPRHKDSEAPSPSAFPSTTSSKEEITSYSETGAAPVELKGLWGEAYEQLLRDSSNAKLIKAYESALLEEGGDNKDVRPVESEISPRLQSIMEHRLQEIKNSQTTFHLAGKEIVVRDQVRRAVDLILSVQGVVTSAVSSEPHAALAWAGALVLLVGPITRSVTQDTEATEGFECITAFMARYAVMEGNLGDIYLRAKKSKTSKQLQALSRSIKAQTVGLYAKIIEFQMRLARHYSRSGYFRVMRDMVAPEDWKGMRQDIESIDRSVSRDLEEVGNNTLLHIETLLEQHRESTQSLMIKIEKDTEEAKNLRLLSILRVASQARFESPKNDARAKCFRGTQTNVLNHIRSWILSSGEDFIYWLPGMVGMGKSTISRTVAAQCHNRESLPESVCLGASFFFDRNEGLQNDATYLFPTLCQSLAEYLPQLKAEICISIEGHPNIANESLSNQWKYLILRPLMSLEKKNRLVPLTLVVVIDALDECKPRYEADDVDTILGLITEAQQLSFIRMKFLLTSRPETQIRSSFQNLPASLFHKNTLRKIQPSLNQEDSDDDIKRFVRHRLGSIATKHGITEKWPDEKRFKELIRKADGLWIYAATACKFIEGASRNFELYGNRRLDILLKDDSGVKDPTPQHNLDEIYGRILEDSLLSSTIPSEVESVYLDFQRTVGAIVVLCQPLSPIALSDLLSVDQRETKGIIDGLGSVIHIDGNEHSPIRLAHLSFPEFLTNKQRCLDVNFHISKEEKHTALVTRCLQTLSKTLRQDICLLGDSSTLKENIDTQTVERYLPTHVQYACLYWVEHLLSSNSLSLTLDDGPVHLFLKTHLLHWIESLSIMGRMSEGISAVIKLSEHFKSLRVS
ncbi:uncharacterized protein LDX57_000212 [Aspergillus melleus]|uniref:uncharacterized protein n=1 Tax=Aspergillus melleus TaxID=138277 RepID=UPI001E8E09CE|nr:uncharacterized protein LDX57_000212 [Aspergillus melleus]KAH8422457.1 hypothetical protein LDX57_000212 [Aspergillus melleus]